MRKIRIIKIHIGGKRGNLKKNKRKLEKTREVNKKLTQDKIGVEIFKRKRITLKNRENPHRLKEMLAILKLHNPKLTHQANIILGMLTRTFS